MAQPRQAPQTGPPYLPPTTLIGGIPTLTQDVPISAVLLLLYLANVIVHIAIFRQNHKSPETRFHLTILIIYLCFIRLVTLSLRIAWAAHPHNVPVAIASQILTTAGVVLLFVLNLVFSQRLLRAWHPRVGWGSLASWFFPVVYATVPLSLVVLITCIVQSLYTLNPAVRQRAHDMQLYAATFFLVVAVFPVPFIVGSHIAYRVKLRRKREGRKEEEENVWRAERPMMSGNVERSATLVELAALILVVGAAFRTGVAWARPPLPGQSTWYESKACLYLFDFGTELVVVVLYAVFRLDRRFFVPKASEMRSQEQEREQEQEQEDGSRTDVCTKMKEEEKLPPKAGLTGPSG